MLKPKPNFKRKMLCALGLEKHNHKPDFAINEIRPKFLSLLLTGITRIGVTERGSFKKYSGRRCISRSSNAVQNIKLPFTYSEYTVQMQNQL